MYNAILEGCGSTDWFESSDGYLIWGLMIELWIACTSLKVLLKAPKIGPDPIHEQLNHDVNKRLQSHGLEIQFAMSTYSLLNNNNPRYLNGTFAQFYQCRVSPYHLWNESFLCENRNNKNYRDQFCRLYVILAAEQADACVAKTTISIVIIHSIGQDSLLLLAKYLFVNSNQYVIGEVDTDRTVLINKLYWQAMTVSTGKGILHFCHRYLLLC